jgi:hypothetical protein
MKLCSTKAKPCVHISYIQYISAEQRNTVKKFSVSYPNIHLAKLIRSISTRGGDDDDHQFNSIQFISSTDHYA